VCTAFQPKAPARAIQWRVAGGFVLSSSANHPAHPALVCDFAAVRAGLDSAQVAEPTLLVPGCDRAVAHLSQSSPVARAMVQLWRTLTKTTGVHT